MGRSASIETRHVMARLVQATKHLGLRDAALLMANQRLHKKHVDACSNDDVANGGNGGAQQYDKLHICYIVKTIDPSSSLAPLVVLDTPLEKWSWVCLEALPLPVDADNRIYHAAFVKIVRVAHICLTNIVLVQSAHGVANAMKP